MVYKSLLTVVTDTEICASAIDRAIALAQINDAHLDVDCLGIDRTQSGYYYGGANALIQQDSIKEAMQQAEALKSRLHDRLTPEDISWACSTGVAQLLGLGRTVSHRARFCDLAVLPQPYGKGSGPEHETIVEAVMFDGHAPALVVPRETDAPIRPKRIIVAWNGGAEALAAIRAALPMLQDADSVNIAVIDPPAHGPDRSDPGGALSQMLARHGVTAEISVLAKTMPRVADILKRHIRDLDANLLVMGAYGHSRFREAILGGVTRDMLEMSEIPVLMAH